MHGPICTTVASFQPFARWKNIPLSLFCARHCLWLWLPPWKTQVLGSWLAGWAPRPAVGEAWCLEEASWRQFAAGNCPVKGEGKLLWNGNSRSTPRVSNFVGLEIGLGIGILNPPPGDSKWQSGLKTTDPPTGLFADWRGNETPPAHRSLLL